MAAYQMTIGLEIHVELNTNTKIFCGCSVERAAAPNTHICPVCLGMPGTLPVLNRQVVEYAVKAGRALGCSIAETSKLDRKNYTYPDLPKGYQISQYDLPLCVGGSVTVPVNGADKIVRITRIHIEEDAGKLIHMPGTGTLLDCNRCGVPLLEIVTEPDMHAPEEAAAFVKRLREILIGEGVSDCKMNEGAMRVDVNLSVNRAGDSALGTRTETKNLNSVKSVAAAIRAEYVRQTALLEAGETVEQQTRRYSQKTGETTLMRSKEDAEDYRYFPDPDLPMLRIPSVK